MVDLKKLSGTWRGRLIDVQGFEGELRLDVAARSDGRISGEYGVTIGATHTSMVQRGKLTGAWKDGVLTLGFALEKPPVKVAVKAEALALRDGGVGLTGVYKVSARNFSPLQGGVISVSKDRRHADEVLEREKYG